MSQIIVSHYESPQHSKPSSNPIETLGYYLSARLSEGTFSKVYQAEYRDHASNRIETMACKVIDMTKCSVKFRKKFLPRELTVLLRLCHPHIIQVRAIIKCHTKIFIFMRQAERGDLLTYILDHGAVPEVQARLWSRQLALALQYLHESGIAHRDLKCENVLITANYNVKLSDFGFARYIMKNNQLEMSSTFCGSFDYAAPEILQSQSYNAKASDMWAYGVVLYVMLNKSVPFKGKTRAVCKQQTTRCWRFRSRLQDILSDEVKTLVTSLLEPNVFVRWTVEEVLICDWFVMDSRLRSLNDDEFNALAEAKGRLDTVRRFSTDFDKVQVQLKDSGSETVVTTIKDTESGEEEDFLSSSDGHHYEDEQLDQLLQYNHRH